MRYTATIILLSLLSGCITSPDLVLYKGDDAATIKGSTGYIDAGLGSSLSISYVDKRYISGYEPTILITPGEHEIIVRTSDFRKKYKNVSDTPVYWYKVLLNARSGVSYEFLPLPYNKGSRHIVFFKIEASDVGDGKDAWVCKQSGPGSFSHPGKFDCDEPKLLPLFD